MQGMTNTNCELILREYFQMNKSINKVGENLIFDNSISIRADTPTPFIQNKLTGKKYNIGSLWHYLKFKDEPLGVYVNECRKEKLDHIQNKDKEAIREYFLHGNDNIDIFDKEFNNSNNELLGKKHLKEESNDNKQNANSTDNNKNNDIKEEKKDTAILQYSDSSLNVIHFMSLKDRNNINRNSILRVSNIKFDNVLSLCRKTFMKSSQNKEENKNIRNSFLEELLISNSKT